MNAMSAVAQDRDAKRGYVSVNGLKIYYEIKGAGRPLLLLHGVLTTINSCFGELLPSFAKTRQVILLPHSQLAVLPGTDHFTLLERADWLLSMIGTFLDAPRS
jgi:pimeloyl-ACP methyl ester carboxylesterase